MKHGMVRTIVLFSCVMWSPVARGQSFESGIPVHDAAPGVSGLTDMPGGSWQAWLHHGAHHNELQSSVPARRPEVAGQSVPLSPSTGTGSELLDPEVGRVSLGLRSIIENAPAGTGFGREER